MSNSIAQKFNVFSLLKFAFPTMVMMVFMSLYTIVDGIFVSRLVGSNALSAVNIVYPVINLLFAFGIMLSTGGSAIVARQLGEKKDVEARENFSLIALVSVLVGVVILVGGLVFLEPLCKVLGATSLILSDCKVYLGVLGAALATGLGQAIMAVVGVVYFFAIKKGLRFVMPRVRGKVLLESCGNGSSEMVSNLSTAVVTFLFNLTMLRLLGEDGVAAITIVLYGQFLFTSLYLGFSMGVAPVFSFNYGERNYDQLKKIYKICICFIVFSSVVILALALFFAEPIVGIFCGRETRTYEIASEGFLLFSWNYLFAGINMFASAMFTAFGDGKISAIISFCRTFVFIVVSILFLPTVMGINGVWLSVPLAEFATLFIAVWYFKSQHKKYQYA